MSVDAQSVTMSQQTSQVLSKAALRAAAILGLTHKELAEIVGVSPAFISKIKAGAATLAIGSKQAELAAIFVRVFRALDAIVGGDEETARAWLRNPNAALGQVPADYIMSIGGLLDTASYLDQRRAIV